MRADLHTHSIFSDGYYTPDELCRRAKENGVELLSVTDHDTLNGEEEKLTGILRSRWRRFNGNCIAGIKAALLLKPHCSNRNRRRFGKLNV